MYKFIVIISNKESAEIKCSDYDLNEKFVYFLDNHKLIKSQFNLDKIIGFIEVENDK